MVVVVVVVISSSRSRSRSSRSRRRSSKTSRSHSSSSSHSSGPYNVGNLQGCDPLESACDLCPCSCAQRHATGYVTKCWSSFWGSYIKNSAVKMGPNLGTYPGGRKMPLMIEHARKQT